MPGEDLPGVHDALDYLHALNGGTPPDFAGKTVVVVGGGNVAIDSARSALRLGARAVRLVCLESSTEMPAHRWEIQEAEELVETAKEQLEEEQEKLAELD